MEENKVVAFPGSEEAEVNPVAQKATAMLEGQDAIISELVEQICRSIDARAAEDKTLPIFIPMETGIAITATYLNMINDEAGTPIESMLEEVNELAGRMNDAADVYFQENPNVSQNVFYYALLHATSASLRHQRLINNVNYIAGQTVEGEE